MRKLLALFLPALLLAACTGPLDREDNTYVPEQGTCIFRAVVEPLSGVWTWNAAADRLGVYGEGTDNAVFCPRASFDGKTGTAEFFGPGVFGQAYAYLPWKAEGVAAAALGRMPLSSEQTFFEGASAHIEGNTSVLVAAADSEGLLRFRNPCGTLKLRLEMDITENVENVSISANEPLCGWLDVTGSAEEAMINPERKINVSGIGRPCTAQTPLIVWVMVPAGTYTGLYLTAAGASESISTIVEGSFTVERGGECQAVVREKRNEYGGTDFEGEEVDYD